MMQTRRALCAIFLGAMALGAHAQAPAQGRTERVRGTLDTVSASQLVVRTRGGERITLAVSPQLQVNEVYPVALSDIKPNTFIGVGAMPQPDGTQRAIAVTLFPEEARGRGEGHYPFDFTPGSTMTNATVAEAAASPSGDRLRLRYKDGEKIIVVPPGTPVVSFRPAQRDLLVPGASVSVTAGEVNGVPTALRINAGRKGFAVPY